MKLLYCKGCQDVVRPLIGVERTCHCGCCKITGQNDGLTVSFSGKKAVIFGFKNSSFISAIYNQPESGQGKEFTAFVVPKKCETVIEKNENSSHTS